jgi:aerobic-type carbon monoxide dehydrogenase small subunit (CoxS/CutS family)
MTDQQPQAPGGPGNSGSWEPVPGGGDYDPDQTMHVSFAAQLPPEPLPGEDPLGAHGPVGPDGDQEQPGRPAPGAAEGNEGDAATSWTIPVIRDDSESDSGEYSVGAFAPSWDQAPSPAAPTQSFPAGMFGQGAAAAAQAAETRAAQARTQDRQTHGGQTHGGPGGPAPRGVPAGEPGQHTGQWPTPFTGPEGGDAVPWLPAHAPAADAAWSGVVDDPDSPADPGAAPYGHPADEPGADGPGGYRTSGDALAGGRAPADDAGHGAAGNTGHLGSGPADTGEFPGGHGFPASGEHGTGDLTSGGPGAGNAYGDGAYAGSPGGQDADALTGSAPLPDGRALPAPGEHGSPEQAGTEQADADPAGAEQADTDPADTDHPDTGDAFTGGDESAEDGFDPEAEPEPEPEPVEETRSEHPLASYMLRVNGTDRPVTDAWLGESLLYVLRERLGLAGAKDGCEEGECGACSVKVDGRLVASCLVPAATAAGSEVRTVEGLTVDGRPSDVQRALAECGAVQCGFCVPGMAMTVHDLLEGNHRPTELDVRQALSGNLCRCSGYRGVLDAVQQVVAARETDDDPAPDDFARVPHQGGPSSTAGGAQ